MTCSTVLYKDPKPTLDSNLPVLPLHPTLEKEPGILVSEVRMAIDSLKKNKAVGIDGISAEEIQAATTEKGSVVLHHLCQSVWGSEPVPDEWKKAIIVPIHKKKDKMDCNNYRGVSILCHCSKVYSNIQLRRMRKRMDEILAEEQAGFRAQRNTTEQIFVLRQVVEKYMEMNKDLFA